MPQRDAAALRVDHVVGDSELALGAHDDRGEGFVDLDEIQIGCGESLPLERPGDGARRLRVQ